ncbi:hypothetical protein JYQ62_16055 [Nostoc sp. UHCC 0702]|nr:hypothetical protein JYQ62_16055 [Nostoc sp. UHCC 0702]
MTRLSYNELKALVNENYSRVTWHEVAKYGKTTSRAAIIKALLAAGFQHEGLVLDEEIAPVALKPGTIPYMQEQVKLALGLSQISKGIANNAIIDRLDDAKVSNGIVAITLQGKSGKDYWTYALSVIEKILGITLSDGIQSSGQETAIEVSPNKEVSIIPQELGIQKDGGSLVSLWKTRHNAISESQQVHIHPNEITDIQNAEINALEDENESGAEITLAWLLDDSGLDYQEFKELRKIDDTGYGDERIKGEPEEPSHSVEPKGKEDNTDYDMLRSSFTRYINKAKGIAGNVHTLEDMQRIYIKYMGRELTEQEIHSLTAIAHQHAFICNGRRVYSGFGMDEPIIEYLRNLRAKIEIQEDSGYIDEEPSHNTQIAYPAQCMHNLFWRGYKALFGATNPYDPALDAHAWWQNGYDTAHPKNELCPREYLLGDWETRHAYAIEKRGEWACTTNRKWLDFNEELDHSVCDISTRKRVPWALCEQIVSSLIPVMTGYMHEGQAYYEIWQGEECLDGGLLLHIGGWCKEASEWMDFLQFCDSLGELGLGINDEEILITANPDFEFDDESELNEKQKTDNSLDALCIFSRELGDRIDSALDKLCSMSNDSVYIKDTVTLGIPQTCCQHWITIDIPENRGLYYSVERDIRTWRSMFENLSWYDSGWEIVDCEQNLKRISVNTTTGYMHGNQELDEVNDPILDMLCDLADLCEPEIKPNYFIGWYCLAVHLKVTFNLIARCYCRISISTSAGYEEVQEYYASKHIEAIEYSFKSSGLIPEVLACGDSFISPDDDGFFFRFIEMTQIISHSVDLSFIDGFCADFENLFEVSDQVIELGDDLEQEATINNIRSTILPQW